MTVAPKVSGYIVEVYVADNQSVPAGAPLVRLDNRQYQAALDQLTATTAGAQGGYRARGEADLLAAAREHRAGPCPARGRAANETYALAQIRRYEPLVASAPETGERLAELRNAHNQAAATLDGEQGGARIGRTADRRDAGADPASARAARGCRRERRVGAARCGGYRGEELDRRSRGRPHGACRSIRTARDAADDHRARARHLSRGELQGDADRPDAGRPAGDHSCRRTLRRGSARRRWRASRRAPAPSSRCCRLRTPPATSPRSCSGCRCAFTSMPATEARKVLVPGLSVTVKVDTRGGARRAQAHRVGERPWLSREPPSPTGSRWRRGRWAR